MAILFILLPKLFQVGTTVGTGNSFRLVHASNMPSSFLALPYFMALSDIPYSSCILNPSPRMSHFPKDASSFYWRMVSEIKVWVLVMLGATEVVLCLDSLSGWC